MLSFHYRWRNGFNGDKYPLDSVSCDTILPFIIYFHQAINLKKNGPKLKDQLYTLMHSKKKSNCKPWAPKQSVSQGL